MDFVLSTADVYKKIKSVESECHRILTGLSSDFEIPDRPARDLPVAENRFLAKRVGLQSAIGQAQLLHDLANIELQAMELCLRTLYEYPDAPKDFREQLADLAIEESLHLELCLKGIEQLGFFWGQWPVHTNLWDAVRSENSLAERIFIVHCYLEGSGLDSGEMILQKLSGVQNKNPREIVRKIADDEKDHVRFGLNWFEKIARPEFHDFQYLLTHLKHFLPHRSAKICHKTRKLVGFDDHQIQNLEKFCSN